jgi:hypothetical protein
MHATHLKIALALMLGMLVDAGAPVRAGEPPATTGQANDIDLSVVPPDRFTGEPYVLAGKRIVFTTWYYVRPGGYAWKLKDGENVTVTRKKAVGPSEAHFERKWDVPVGVRLVAQRPRREGPVVKSEQPWDEQGIGIRQVLKDGEKYRAWGGVEDKQGRVHTAYYESADGREWTRPSLGMVEYDGSKENNLLADFPGTVFIDPSAPAAERYKSVGGEVEISFEEFKAFAKKHPDRWESRALRADRKMERPILSVTGFVSADGLTWRKLDEPFTVEHSDTLVVGGYDVARKKYIIFTRNYFVGPRAVGAPMDPAPMSWLGEFNGSGRRSIGYMESDRFRDFPLSRLILAPRSDFKPTEMLYTNCYTTIPGAPDHYLLFPSIWDTTTDATHLQMAASHDAQVWNWVPGGSLMETNNFGEFDGGCMFWTPSLTELPNGDFVLPYTGFSYPHKYPRKNWKYGWGYAVWPKGRIVALEAAERGEFTTVGLMPPGRKLRINAVTARAGSIKIAVCTRDGVMLPGRSFEECKPIVGDQYHTLVEWNGGAGDDLGFENGQPVCLRFQMDHAQIFGLDFE